MCKDLDETKLLGLLFCRLLECLNMNMKLEKMEQEKAGLCSFTVEPLGKCLGKADEI